MAQTVHTVVGIGEASDKAIIESLRDALNEGDAVNIIWAGKPNDSVAAVYDFVTDEKMDFTIFYEDGQTVPGFLRNFETGTAQKSRDPEAKALSGTTGKVLMLWDDDTAQDLVEKVFDNIDEGTLVLELTNGLTPIELDEPPADDGETPQTPGEKYGEDEPAPTEEEPAEDADEFSKAELENMAAGAVKRYGVQKGTEATTKKGIIAELFDKAEEEPEPAPAEEPEEASAEAPRRLDEHGSVPNHVRIVDKHQLKRSLSNVTPSDEAIATIEDLRKLAVKLGDAILDTPPSRERSLAVTNLEQTVMWAVKNVVLQSEEV